MYDNHIAVGGLAGSTSGTIENSYYNGQITYNGEGVEHYKKINIGGIAGKIAGEENDTPAINNCYSNAVITADDEVSSKGIITGYAKTGTIVTCCYGSDNGKLDIIGTSNGTSKDNQLQDTIASVDFVNWLISSETGKDYMTNKLGNNAPFTTFSDSEKPSDPLAQDMLGSMESGKTSIPWVFTTFPSQTFKDNFGAALLEYAQGTKTWEDVVSYVNEQWATEKAAVAE